MVWWLMKQCFSAMIRSLRLTTPSVECVAVKFCTVSSYLLILYTNHRRFKHGVVVSERVFFSDDKTITACVVVSN